MGKRVVREITDDMTKWKMSLAKQQGLNVNYGKPRDEETKQKISDSMKNIGSPFHQLTMTRIIMIKINQNE